MSNTIHRNFLQSADAESARADLLAAGFPASAVTLNSHAAVAADPGTSVVDNLMHRLTPDESAAASAKPKPAALLTVDVDDDQQAAQAAAIMQRYGASEA